MAETTFAAGSAPDPLSPEGAAAPEDRRFNVKDYGAAGDGFTDDKQFIQDALNAAGFEGGWVYFPHGTYVCSGKLTYDFPRSVGIIGAGRGLSNLHFTSTAGGFDIDFPAHHLRFVIARLTLKAGTLGAGAAIDVTWPFVNGSTFKHATIDDLEITSFNEESPTFFWTYGIRLTNGGMSVIRGVQFRGRTNTVSSAAAIELLGTSNDLLIEGCHLHFTDVGINVPWSEGTVVRDCFITYHNVGIRSLYAGFPSSPWIAVLGCFIWVFHRGILLRNRNEPMIANNVIYRWKESTADFWAIDCQSGCHQAKIHDNEIIGFNETGQGSANGIAYDALYGIIHHNYAAQVITGITLKDSARNCVVQHNLTLEPGNPLVDTGISNFTGPGANYVATP